MSRDERDEWTGVVSGGSNRITFMEADEVDDFSGSRVGLGMIRGCLVGIGIAPVLG